MIPSDVADQNLLKSDCLKQIPTITREYSFCQAWGLRRKLIYMVYSKPNVLIKFFKIIENILVPFYAKAWRHVAVVITSA